MLKVTLEARKLVQIGSNKHIFFFSPVANYRDEKNCSKFNSKRIISCLLDQNKKVAKMWE